MKIFLRHQTKELISRLEKSGILLQIIVGPRQVGKTTAIRQILDIFSKKGFFTVFASADLVAAPPLKWISDYWQKASEVARTGKPVILAFDELQKIPGWSEVVKLHLDSDYQQIPGHRPRIILSGSSALLIERGLTESLAGRFEIIRFPHWELSEMNTAFEIDFENYLIYGGYPRIDEFQSQLERFLQYIRDSIIEPVLAKDILLLHPVNKPALLRRLFEFSCYHCAEVISLQKMLGQLTDKGNVITIADYLELLNKAFLVAPIQKYSPEILRIRASSPKLIVMSQALVSAMRNVKIEDIRKSSELFGRLVENAVGAALFRFAEKNGAKLFYWRERNLEVDYILKMAGKILAIEVKSAGVGKHSGMSTFLARNKNATGLFIGDISQPKSVPALTLKEFLESSERITQFL